MSMAQAIFTKKFNFSSRKANAGWEIKPKRKPQSFPAEVIDAAIEAGVAKAFTPKKSKE